jgi:two-component system, NarL family, nitrate/nitrite response regulator NarL
MPASSPPIRILLVDDAALFRHAISELIDRQENLEVIGEAENGLEAVEKAKELRPDLIVMDVEMPLMDGVEATRVIREELPEIKVVMLTVSDADEHLFDAIRFGAHGYLLKDLRPEELYALVRSVMRNEPALSPMMAERLLEQVREPAAPFVTIAPETLALTRRELDILELVAEGFTNKEIAAKLFIAEGTVKNHVHHTLEKLQLENRTQAAAYVLRGSLGRPAGPQ